MTDILDNIRNLIPKNFSNIKDFFRLLYVSRFFFNFYKEKERLIQLSNQHYHVWKKEVEKNLDENKN